MLSYNTFSKQKQLLLALQYAIKQLPETKLQKYIKKTFDELHTLCITEWRKDLAHTQYIEKNLVTEENKEQYFNYHTFLYNLQRWDVLQPSPAAKQLEYDMDEFLHINPEEGCCSPLDYPKLCKPRLEFKKKCDAIQAHIDEIAKDTRVPEHPQDKRNYYELKKFVEFLAIENKDIDCKYKAFEKYKKSAEYEENGLTGDVLCAIVKSDVEKSPSTVENGFQS